MLRVLKTVRVLLRIEVLVRRRDKDNGKTKTMELTEKLESV